MRVYPTFPNENGLVESFIDGAKQIWDSWAGPKKLVVQQDVE
jgi:hypothetical protein